MSPVIESGPTAEIPPEPVIVTGGGIGHVFGLVTDSGSKPLLNATVELAGTGIEVRTLKNGTFSLRDLPEGAYGITASYKDLLPAVGTIHVLPDKTVRPWLQLKPLPPPPPHHVTHVFNGSVIVTADPVLGLTFACDGCSQRIDLEPWLRSTIVEAELDQNSPVPVRPFPDPFALHNQTMSFSFSDGDLDWYASGPNPLWARSEGKFAGTAQLFLNPGAYPAPETQRPFKLYVTTFYGTPAPAGWSYLAGYR